MSSYAVIGGGVSGLAAARTLALSRAGDVTVFEASGRFGGKVLTAALDSLPIDLGPDQFLRRDPSAEQWCRDLGLGDFLVAPEASTAGVFSHGRARQLPRRLALGIPTDLAEVAASGIVSEEGCRLAGQAGLGLAPLTPAELGLETDGPAVERSAGAILRERLGDEVVDRLVDPLLGGINGGGVDSLSLAVAAPQIARGLAGRRDVVEALSGVVSPGDGPSASPFFGLAGGLGQLTGSAVRELSSAGVVLRASAPVDSMDAVVGPSGSRIRLVLERGEPFMADGVVVATPGPATAALLSRLSPEAATLCRGVPYSSVVLTTLVLPPGALDVPPSWSGVLVPRVEGFVTTAVSFLTRKWGWLSRHAFGGRPVDVLRVSAGRFSDDRALQMADGELIDHLLSDLATIVGLRTRPLTSHVQRWEGAFPQYLPGHAARVAHLLADLEGRPSVALAGALLGGIGVPACISSGAEAARRLLERVPSGRG